LPADILGQTYEQFLGKVIRLTPSHRAVVEDKPEVKKAGGVYYTPTYIVDYIVSHTVGKLLEGKTPRQAAKLTICDPACGSGSFLLGAYQYLLDWHLKWYAENTPEKWAKGRDPKIYQVLKGEWRLTTNEKKRILLNNIYGVDIDQQAVEVTKLSLLLKVLENETQDTLGRQMSMFHERALPDLATNIKCGNSLIGPDFYDQQDLGLMDEEERYRINVFDWQAEFPDIFAGKTPGFDAVIGNPPYLNVSEEAQLNYLRTRYSIVEGRVDLFEAFIERASKITKVNGFFAYIVPSPVLTNQFSRKIRKLLLQKNILDRIITFAFPVFADPTVHTCIYIALRSKPNRNQQVKIWAGIESPEELHSPCSYPITQNDLGYGEGQAINVFLSPSHRALLTRLAENTKPFGDLCFVRQCIKTGNDDKYVCESTKSLGSPWRPSLRGRDMGRYQIVQPHVWVMYGNWLARNWANQDFYDRPKILVRETGNRITATLDEDHRFVLSSLYAVYPKAKHSKANLKFLLGILNSLLINNLATVFALNATRGAFTKFRTNQLATLPIRVIDAQNTSEKAQYDHMVDLVERMLSLHKQLAAARTGQDNTMIQRQITATDRQIDRLVYELYDLTKEEVAIVEEPTNPA